MLFTLNDILTNDLHLYGSIHSLLDTIDVVHKFCESTLTDIYYHPRIE